MADHRALGRLGWTFGVITAVVFLTAVAVVTINPGKSADAGETPFAATATASSAVH